YDPTAAGYVSTKKITASNVAQARNEAISYAAWTVLRARYEKANGGEDSVAEFDAVLESLCYTQTRPLIAKGADPARVGIDIAEAVLARGLTDGSNEADG